jgi:serine/threonine-protein kinase
MVSEQGKVKVIDLGQACPIGTAKERIQGTPDYIAPEQVKCKPVLPQTDIFNFGASLYFALTGSKLPTLFTLKKGDNSFLVDSEIALPSKLNPKVSDNLSSFVMECVRTNPLKRPEGMSTVVSRLEILHHCALKSEAARRPPLA